MDLKKIEDPNLKLLGGILMQLFYKEPVLKKFQESVSKSPEPAQTMAQLLAMLMMRGVEEAQKAGAELNNQTVMKGLMILVKEIIEMLEEEGSIDKKQAKELAPGLVALTTRAIAELSKSGGPGQGQGGAQPPDDPAAMTAEGGEMAGGPTGAPAMGAAPGGPGQAMPAQGMGLMGIGG